MTLAHLSLAVLLAALAAPTLADRERPRDNGPLLPLYRQECGSCHLAYPPALLPAASWRRITATLDRHYGSDASLDPATVERLSRWLLARSGDQRPAPPQDRISRSAWFVHEHDEIPTATWKRASIGSAAHCAACHRRADQGEFDEHDVRIPR